MTQDALAWTLIYVGLALIGFVAAVFIVPAIWAAKEMRRHGK